MSQLTAIVVGVVISDVYYPGFILPPGIEIDLRPQPCMPPGSGAQQAIVYQPTPSGDKIFICKFNLSAVADVFYPASYDNVPEEFAILEQLLVTFPIQFDEPENTEAPTA